jgi:hypothetical protein
MTAEILSWVQWYERKSERRPRPFNRAKIA